ncbi:MAG: hypothetical protein K2G70_07410, partial [Turicibacter sp.]|nr:hypothetical protein [Turicibacter sp.]
MKKFSLGMLFAATTLIFGGCQSLETPQDKNVEVSELEGKDDALARLSKILGEEVYSIKTTYYNSNLFRHLALDNLYWTTTDLQTDMIESDQTVFLTDVEDEVIKSEEHNGLENALVDNLDVKEETLVDSSSNNNESSSSNTTTPTKPSTSTGSSNNGSTSST